MTVHSSDVSQHAVSTVVYTRYLLLIEGDSPLRMCIAEARYLYHCTRKPCFSFGIYQDMRGPYFNHWQRSMPASPMIEGNPGSSLRTCLEAAYKKLDRPRRRADMSYNGPNGVQGRMHPVLIGLSGSLSLGTSTLERAISPRRPTVISPTWQPHPC